MSIHLTKIWWDLNKHKLVEKAIPEAEIYKRKWVGLTDEEAMQICIDCGCMSEDWLILLNAIETKLKEKNT